VSGTNANPAYLSMRRKFGDEAAAAPELRSHSQVQAGRDLNRFGITVAMDVIRPNELPCPVEILQPIRHDLPMRPPFQRANR
jgi:hypothetical protein